MPLDGPKKHRDGSPPSGARLRIADVYDTAELAAISPGCIFRQVDQAIAYRTRQMLAAPIVSEAGQLLGVIQLLNRIDGQPFDAAARPVAAIHCATMAVAVRARPVHRPLAVPQIPVAGGRCGDLRGGTGTGGALGLRRKGLDIEQVLVDEYQVNPGGDRAGCRKRSACRTSRFRAIATGRPNYWPDWIAHRRNSSNGCRRCTPTKVGLTVLSTDPDHANDGNRIGDLFPYPGFYRVTTQQEFHPPWRSCTADRHWPASRSGSGAQAGFTKTHVGIGLQAGMGNQPRGRPFEPHRDQQQRLPSVLFAAGLASISATGCAA